MNIAIFLVEIIIGAIVLAWSADRFIAASVTLAKHFKLSPLVIGVVLVGFGTSFPELIVSFFAAIHDSGDIAIGNVVGSNIANIGLVLGISALIAPIHVHSQLIKRELPALIAVSIIMGFIFWAGYLYFWEGFLLLAILALHLYWMLSRKPDQKDPIMPQIKQETQKTMSFKAGIIWWFIGLILLLGSSELFIVGAVGLAKLFHISELIIGITVVTLGTSLPELAATIASVLKNEHDIAIGHIVGSNIFNSLAVLAMPALFNPGKLSRWLMCRDYPVMLGYTIILWLVLSLSPKKIIGRWLAGVLMLGYVTYLATLAVF